MERHEIEKILSLVNREVVIAIGCTEPVAVALCTAKAKELLGIMPEKITAYLSANVLKNAMGVGIPGTGGITGLPIAIALGALIGKSEYCLEVLKDSCPDAVEDGKRMIEDKAINILLKEDICEKLYIEVVCEAGDESAKAIISGTHTNFVYLEKNGETLLNSQKEKSEHCDDSLDLNLTLKKVYDFSMETPFKDISCILESARVNKGAAETAFKGSYGHCLGKLLGSTNGIMGDNLFTKILSYTSAACDARMAGAMIPVMSNSGSGNQGIAATLPIVIYAEENKNTEEELARALMLGHLTPIYIKQRLGRLSALCGCVVAATGTSCGIVHLMGGNYNQVCYAVKNMIANLTGVICDGAKPGCSMKITSGVSTAVFSAIMALENRYVSSVEGIIDEDVDKSIRNLAKIGAVGMEQTDKVVLDIMTHKD
ncbi:MAG: L-serine ammonia-lyase, iron-sulfur-dependent, subunit alpha [Prevotellaceae bacterium]|jgi:L-cysteine desulfidase|nr:L-serine ammonia-lyase, iron-sulfur-dependent, subunit alpha [Prevotellaceae bacterium]